MQIFVFSGNCSFVCPHSVIRSKFYHKDLLTEVPEGFQSAPSVMQEVFLKP